MFLSSSSNYGKGAEMWPPGLEDDTVMDLRDSFPDGKVPPLTPVASLTKKEQEEPLRWSNLLSKQNRLALLRRAARSQEDQELMSEEADNRKTVPLLMLAATLLVIVRHLQPLDYLLVTSVTGYLVVLQKLAAQQRQSFKNNNNLLVPVLPALPPQGHVPVTNQTPLGYALTQSRDYRRWLRLGEVLGWWAPMLLLLLGTTTKLAAATTALQPVAGGPSPLFSRRPGRDGTARDPSLDDPAPHSHSGARSVQLDSTGVPVEVGHNRNQHNNHTTVISFRQSVAGRGELGLHGGQSVGISHSGRHSPLSPSPLLGRRGRPGRDAAGPRHPDGR